MASILGEERLLSRNNPSNVQTDSQFRGNSKPQHAPIPGLLKATTQDPAGLLRIPLGPFFSEGQSILDFRIGSCTYRRWVRFLNYPTLTKAPASELEAVFYPGRRTEIPEQQHGVRSPLRTRLAINLN